MSKSEFSMVLSDFLHSSEGAKFKTDFEFDGELVCGEPAPPIRVSKFSVGFYQFSGPSEHIPAKHALETLVNSSGKCFSSIAWKPIISAGLELVISHTEKWCIATYYNQFSTNINMYNHKINPIFLARIFGISGLKILKLYILYPWKAVYNTMRELTIINVIGSLSVCVCVWTRGTC